MPQSISQLWNSVELLTNTCPGLEFNVNSAFKIVGDASNTIYILNMNTNSANPNALYISRGKINICLDMESLIII